MNECLFSVCIDMQNDFIYGSLGNPTAQQIVSKVADHIKQLKTPVIFTRDTHNGDYLKTSEGKYLPIPHCMKESSGWCIADQIMRVIESKSRDDFMIINKDKFGSFDLVSAIRNNFQQEPNKIEIFGLCTDICVITNALILKTWFPDVPIVCRSGLCAGTSAEAHKAALTVMKSCQIEIE